MRGRYRLRVEPHTEIAVNSQAKGAEWCATGEDCRKKGRTGLAAPGYQQRPSPLLPSPCRTAPPPSFLAKHGCARGATGETGGLYFFPSDLRPHKDKKRPDFSFLNFWLIVGWVLNS